MNTQASWNQKILIILDPILKATDSVLYSYIQDHIEDNNYSTHSEIEGVLADNSEYLKTVFIYNQSRLQSDAHLFKKSHTLYLEYQSANMSLFESTQAKDLVDLYFSFKNEEDFINRFKVLKNHFNNLFITLQNQLVKTAESTLKKNLIR